MNRPGFLDPQVTQYGNHMVMTNVTKPTKHKYINIDTKFREEYNKYNQYSLNKTSNYINETTYYTFTLPDRITDVKSMMVCTAEIPISFCNISSCLGNNCFQLVNINTEMVYMVIVPDGQYNTIAELTDEINAILATVPAFAYISFDWSSTNTIITNQESYNYYINFNTDISGNLDKYNFKYKLGTILGFREPTYEIIVSATLTSEYLYDLNGPRYLYLVVDEFSNANPSSFIVPNCEYLTKSNIIAKITMNNKVYGYNSILPANNFNGYLLTDKRTYAGKIDIQRLRVQLVNDLGNSVNLNGSDFSFCLEVEHE